MKKLLAIFLILLCGCQKIVKEQHVNADWNAKKTSYTPAFSGVAPTFANGGAGFSFYSEDEKWSVILVGFGECDQIIVVDSKRLFFVVKEGENAKLKTRITYYDDGTHSCYLEDYE